MRLLKNYINYKIKYDNNFKSELLKLKELEQKDISEINDLENHILVSHIKNAYNKSLFYKNLYNSHGVNLNQIQNRDDLKFLPIITKEDIKSEVDNIYVGSNKIIRHKGHTSGTSGSPLAVYYSKLCINKEAAYVEMFYNNAGFFLGNKCISLRGVLDKNELEGFNKFTNTLFLSSYNINEKNVDFYYYKILHFKPKAIMAYPSSLEMLSNLFLEKGYELNVPVVFTSSETLYSYQKQKIETVFNTKIFDLYGNAERSIMLTQKDSKGFYYEPKLYSINEYSLDSIYTTNIFNKDFPLIRYQVNDTVKLLENSNETVVESIQGRIDDYLFLKDGSKIGRMDIPFKGVNNIKYAQIIQKQLSHFTVNVVPASGFSDKDEALLYKKIVDRVGIDIKFSINIIGEGAIIKTKANKFKLVYNTIQF